MIILPRTYATVPLIQNFGVALAKLLIVYMLALMEEVLLLTQVTLIYLSNYQERNIINMMH